MEKRSRKQIWIAAAALALVVGILPFVGLGGSATDGYDIDSDAYKIDLDVEFASVEPGEGGGTAENPYILTSAGHLEWFAEQVNGGSTALCAKMGADITASDTWTGIGTSSQPFAGTFDGGGYTLTVEMTGGECVAPFPYVNGAIIKNLSVDGTIDASGKFAAGLIGRTTGGGGTITGCVSNVTINSTVSGDGTHGGLVGVAEGSSLTITNCAFTGKILGPDTDSCGGFIGWANASTTITNSYITAEFTVSDTNSYIFSRNPGNVTVTNCYYLNPLGEVNTGAIKKAESAFTSGEVAYRLGAGWGQEIGVDGLPVFGGQAVYASTPCASQFSNTDGVTVNHMGDESSCPLCKENFLVHISVKNIFDEDISGVELCLTKGGNPAYDSAGVFDLSGEYTTTSDSFDVMLPEGNYTLSVSSAPAGYMVQGTVDFSVSSSGGNASLRIHPQMVINAAEDDGSLISGAGCRLTGEDGSSNVIPFDNSDISIDDTNVSNLTRTGSALTWTSGSGPILLSGLPAGTYTLKLTSAPGVDPIVTDIFNTLTFSLTGVETSAVTKNLVVTNEHKHSICGNNCEWTEHTDHAVEKTWSPISSSNLDSLTADGYYYLVEDIVLSNQLTIEANIHLCLNGKSLRAAPGNRVIEIEDGYTFDLCDCSDGETGAITGGAGNNFGGGIYAAGSSSLTIYSGTITGNSAEKGAGVYMADGTFTMYGGSISENDGVGGSYGNGDGAGVYMTNGTFTMYGGSISKNMTEGNGGGVYMASGTFTMHGGSIAENSGHITYSTPGISPPPTFNQESAHTGGGVCMHGGTFTMRGGSISENRAHYGGGVELRYLTAAEMYGGEISKNQALGGSQSNAYFNGGGGVCISDCTFSMHGGEIAENHSDVYGGGVYLRSLGSSSFVMDGENAVIRGNTALRGGGAIFVFHGARVQLLKGTITENITKNDGMYTGAISLWGNSSVIKDVEITNNIGAGVAYDGNYSGTITISGKPVITGNTAYNGNTILDDNDQRRNLYLSSIADVFATFDGELTEGARIGVDAYDDDKHKQFLTGDACVGNLDNGNYAKYFFADNPNRRVLRIGDNLYLSAPAESHTNQHDCYCGKVCSHTTEHNLPTGIYWQSVCSIGELLESTLYKNNTAAAFLYNNLNATQANPFTVEDGKTLYLCLNGKTLTVDDEDSIVLGDGAKLVICDCGDGKISGNGLTVTAGSTVEMHSGTITNCTKANGGGVYVEDGGTFNLCGGTISGNTATAAYGGGGVYVETDGTFNLCGAPVVTGNSSVDSNDSGITSNVYIPTGETITINGELTGADSSVGITMAGGRGLFATGWNNGNTAAEVPVKETFFFDDNGVYPSAVGPNGSDVYLEYTYTVEFYDDATKVGQQLFINRVLNFFKNLSLTKAHHELAGWKDSPSGSEASYRIDCEFSRDDINTPDTIVDLYAHWTAKQYNVTFNSNDGANRTKVQIFTYDAPMTLYPNTFTRAGYTFEGWNTDEDADVASYENEHVFTPNANALYDGGTDSGKTLYAIWNALDENGNGIPDAQDPTADIDGDNVPNAVDPDDDGNGIPDWADPDHDSDGDGMPDYLDPDDDDENDTTGTDGVGNDDSTNGDADDDGDGIKNEDDPDHPTFWDGDGDGDVDDGTYWTPDDDGDYPGENDPTGTVPSEKDSDGDGIPDVVDPTDGGTPKPFEDYDPFGDPDNDGIPNASDDDNDGDHIPDWIDPYDPYGDVDGDDKSNWADDNDDGDGQNDTADPDDDNDGILDENDPDHSDFWDPEDTGGSGVDKDDPNEDEDGDDVPNAIDKDNDGNADTDANTDTDGDGVADGVDKDDDDPSDQNGDGNGDDIHDPDDDDDGIPDIFDPDADSDNDGIPDIFDPDKDGDGVPDAVDPDDDNDGTKDFDDDDHDTDGDGIPDKDDDDDDGDGTPDDPSNPNADDDGDGVKNGDDPDHPLFWDPDGDGDEDETEKNKDTDGDGNPDIVDPDNDDHPGKTDHDKDEDGDGIPNASDNDNDGDGIPDWYDPHVDSDGDGKSDALDDNDDGDGTLDKYDPDDDGDGILDENDPDHPSFWDPTDDGDSGIDKEDPDVDGDDADDIPNAIDKDNNDDGNLDGDVDTDGDGTPDGEDKDDDDPNDQTGDGIDDDLTDTDDDADGIPDIYDPDADSDNDGIPDMEETDGGGNGGNGGGGGGSAPPLTDTDGDGIPDIYDEDDDNDGIPDYLDPNPLVPDVNDPCAKYEDIDRDAWYHEYIDYVVENGLMIGFSDTIFDPEGTTTRAQAVMLIWRLEGSPMVSHPLYFSDITDGAWYIDALRWTNSENIAIGYDDGRFGTNSPVTREQIATLLWRYARYSGIDTSGGESVSLLKFSDAKKISAYAISALQWACSEELIIGTVDKHGSILLDPQGSATRAQVAAILMRFCESILK